MEKLITFGLLREPDLRVVLRVAADHKAIGQQQFTEIVDLLEMQRNVLDLGDGQFRSVDVHLFVDLHVSHPIQIKLVRVELLHFLLVDEAGQTDRERRQIH